MATRKLREHRVLWRRRGTDNEWTEWCTWRDTFPPGFTCWDDHIRDNEEVQPDREFKVQARDVYVRHGDWSDID